MFKIYYVKGSAWLFALYKGVYCAFLHIYFSLWYLFNILHIVYRKFRYSTFFWGPYYRVVWWHSLGVLFKLFYETHLDYYLFIYNLFRYSFIFQGLNLIVFPLIWGFIVCQVALIDPYFFVLSFDALGGIFWVFLQNTIVALFYTMGFLFDSLTWLGAGFFILGNFITIPLTSLFSFAFLNIFGFVFCCFTLSRILFFYFLSIGINRDFQLFAYIFVS